MYNIKIENLDTGQIINFSPVENIAISKTEGLTDVEIDTATSQGFMRVGSTLQGSSVQDRIIKIEGSFMGLSRDLRAKMLNVISPPHNPEETNLKVIYNDSFFELTIAKQTPYITNHVYGAQFQFILHAPYPYWRSMEMIKTAIGETEAKHMFPINYGEPSIPDLHYFGVRTEESYKNIINEGNVTVPFKVLFFARNALANPMIENIETLNHIRINKNMASGEIITIDMTKSILEITSTIGSETKSIMGYYDFDSILFKLKPGDNLIRFDSATYRNQLDCYIYHYYTLSGVFGDDKTFA